MSAPVVHLYPADEGGCGFYRMREPARVLASHPDVVPKVATAADLPPVLWSGEWSGDHPPVGVRPLDVESTPECDVVVLQRPLRHDLARLVPVLQAKGVAVVVEVDDDFDTVPVGNPAHLALDPEASPARNHQWLNHAVSLADAVIVTTPALARRYATPRTFVAPNFVPRSYLDHGRTHGPHAGVGTVGWSGWIETHGGDLDVVGLGVRRALAETGAGFLQVGTRAGVARGLGLPGEVEATGWLPLDEYPAALARLDVGIVPLHDGPFNRAKSWLKGLEMAAVGCVPVATPTPEYVRLEAAGLCFTADSPSAWKRQVSRLAADEVRRQAFSERAHATISAGYTYEVAAERYWPRAWCAAAENAARRRVAA